MFRIYSTTNLKACACGAHDRTVTQGRFGLSLDRGGGADALRPKKTLSAFFWSALAYLLKMLPVKEEEGQQQQPSRCQHDLAMELIQHKSGPLSLTVSSLQGLQKCYNENFSRNRAWKSLWKTPWDFVAPFSSRNKDQKCPAFFTTNFTPLFTWHSAAAKTKFHGVFSGRAQGDEPKGTNRAQTQIFADSRWFLQILAFS